MYKFAVVEKQSPRKEWSPRKLSVSPRKVGLKQGLMPKTLDNYFKLTSKLKNQEEKIPRRNKGKLYHMIRYSVHIVLRVLICLLKIESMVQLDALSDLLAARDVENL